jgi:mannose-6-phosphate isomerase
LSVQVHPDEAVAPSLGGRAKSEAWYILDAEADSKLVVGLEEGTTKQAFKEAIAQQRVQALLKEIPALAGMLLPVRPGTIHAIGAGVMLAEVQQPSDTTYRVYDWGRLGLDGQPRELHLEQALTSIHFDQLAKKADEGSIVDMDRFKIRPLYLEAGQLVDLSGEGPAVLVNLSGKAQITTTGQHAVDVLETGDVLLLPHCLRQASFSDPSDSSASVCMLASTRARILCVTFPVEVKWSFPGGDF